MFALALRLGMTVSELQERMTLTEFGEWIQFFNQQARAADPNTPREIDWEKMKPQDIGALFGRK